MPYDHNPRNARHRREVVSREAHEEREDRRFRNKLSEVGAVLSTGAIGVGGIVAMESGKIADKAVQMGASNRLADLGVMAGGAMLLGGAGALAHNVKNRFKKD